MMEATMRGCEAGKPRYPTVEYMLHAVADWISKHRVMKGMRDELGQCSPEEKMQIAKDLGVSVEHLRCLAAKGAAAADALPKMLSALSVDAQALTNRDPAIMRDLQRTCILCDHKGRCQRELARGSAAQDFHEFCPNAYTFDALLKQASGVH